MPLGHTASSLPATNRSNRSQTVVQLGAGEDVIPVHSTIMADRAQFSARAKLCRYP